MNLLTPDQYTAAYNRLIDADTTRDSQVNRLTADRLTRTLIPHAVHVDAEAERVAALNTWGDDEDTQARRLTELNADAAAIGTIRQKREAA